ncbi:MAG TPA: GSCFA domain-containing protein [Bacteroidales bacterium]|nr:GSCFA domain-containing protein [Bacteroidales bacterium]
MDFRTIIEISDPGFKIGYSDPVLLIGSCFAEEIGASFARGKMDVIVNPFGVLYNPFSVAECIDLLLSDKPFSEKDLFFFDGKYLSFKHDTYFSSPDQSEMLTVINNSLAKAREFLNRSRVLIITFGTSWFYRWRETGSVVANCHKIPESKFIRELADPAEMKKNWDRLIHRLLKRFGNLNIILTVSPVRHLKDGAHGNQISKSNLLLLVNELIETDPRIGYFPSYEIVLDELRDYRFYQDDMIHPSGLAVGYIWSRFKSAYFTEKSSRIYDEIAKISASTKHRLLTTNTVEIKKFADSMLSKIRIIQSKYPHIDLTREIQYFESLSST